MTLHVLVEGPSERILLERWIPRLLRGTPVQVHAHQGKGTLPTNLDDRPDPRRRGLLDQLPATLRGFDQAVLRPTGVVVLVDADDDDCVELAATITAAAQQVAPGLPVQVSIAVEETEAFYLGDLAAVRTAYPNADMTAANSYVPDSICGTWELFGRVVGDGGGNKVLWAESMGPRLTIHPATSRSPSFKALTRTLRKLATVPEPVTPKARPYRHSAKPKKDPGRRR